jgi:outer membrane lipoprotein-sorting protein
LVNLIKILLSVCLLSAPLFAEDAVSHVVARMNSLRSFRANISINNLRGTLSFSNGKSHISLSDGRIISSTGRELMVYDPSTGVAGKQPMVPGGGGLGWLLTGYKVKRQSGTSAVLVSDNPSSKYQEVQIVWGESYTLKQLKISSKTNPDFLTIVLSDIRVVDSFPASLFSYRPPAGSRTVENFLNERN